MNRRFRRARLLLSALRLWPHGILLCSVGADHLICSDIECWSKRLGLRTPSNLRDYVGLLLNFMTFNREFRNVFYLRLGWKGAMFAWLCPPMDGLDITCPSIGPGLFIQHGESTFVTANSIGRNCWIGRQVVVGYSNETDTPTIGDNVRIFAGAKIIGKVNIGNNATIGLNTVIVQDVQPNATMLGVPGKVIWMSSRPEDSSDT